MINILCRYKTGETFGEYGFLTGENNLIIAKSLSVTHMACLRRTDFLSMIREFPDDYVNYIFL